MDTTNTGSISRLGEVCEPGEAGIPDSFIGQLLCGKYQFPLPELLWQWVTTHHTLLTGILLFAVTARVMWGAARLLSWWHPSGQPRWLEITPPVSATPTATVALWRLLAAELRAPRPWTLVPARLVWEVAATPTGMRCGLWVPPGINPLAVTRIVQRAWPGARITDAPAPALPETRHATGRRLAANQPEWLPLLDDPPTANGGPDPDRVHALYDGLAAAGRTGAGLLQIIVTRAPVRRLTAVRKASKDPTKAATRTRPALSVVLLALNGVAAVMRTLFQAFDPASHVGHRHHTDSVHDDPYTAEHKRQAKIRLHQGPHLLIAVRAAAAGPTRAAARASTADITSGYTLLSTELRPHRLPLTRLATLTRWAPLGHFTLATTTETAALAGIPAEPSLYGLPAAAARRRPPGQGTWHTTTPPADAD